MAEIDRNNLDSYIMSCAKKYAEKNKDKRVSIVHTEKSPVNCDVCHGSRITDIEYTMANHVTAICFSKDIKYCFKCGRKL